MTSHPQIVVDVLVDTQIQVVEVAPVVLQGPPGTPAPQYRGAWSPIVEYHPDDIVTRDGSSWIATNTSTGIDPAADASHTVVASLTAASPLALGSPTSVATTFVVDRDTVVSALLARDVFTSPPYNGTVGIAAAINVPAVGVQWLGRGTPDSQAYVLLDEPVPLSQGVEYWLAVQLPQANIQIEHGAQLVGDHMLWADDFWYGAAEPSNDFHGVYGLAVVLYGSTQDDAWQIFVEKGEPGDAGLTRAEADNLYLNAAGDTMQGRLVAGELEALNSRDDGILIYPWGDASAQGAVVPVVQGTPQTGSSILYYSGEWHVQTPLVLPTDGTAPMHAVTKQYTDTKAKAADLDNVFLLTQEKWTRWTGTQAEYDAIPVKDPNTLYVVV